MTFGLFLARKVSLIRALLYIIAQCLGAICGVGLVKGFQSSYYVRYGGGANELSDSVEPLFVDVVDAAVAQELVCRDERSSARSGLARVGSGHGGPVRSGR